MKQPPGSRACSRCGVWHWRSHYYCAACHAEYQRAWSKTHPKTPEQRRKASARSMASSALRRGRIKREPCERCGYEPAQMHHEDYDKPLDVRWLCRSCHQLEHAA